MLFCISRMLQSQSRDCGFDTRPVQFRVITLDKLFTHATVTELYNMVNMVRVKQNGETVAGQGTAGLT